MPKAEDVVRIEEAILHKMAAVPGVTSVSDSANSVPMDGNGWQDPVIAQDESYTDGSMPPLRRIQIRFSGILQDDGDPAG